MAGKRYADTAATHRERRGGAFATRHTGRAGNSVVGRVQGIGAFLSERAKQDGRVATGLRSISGEARL